MKLKTKLISAFIAILLFMTAMTILSGIELKRSPMIAEIFVVIEFYVLALIYSGNKY